MNWLFPIRPSQKLEFRGFAAIGFAIVFLLFNLAFWFLFTLVAAWGAHVGWNIGR